MPIQQLEVRSAAHTPSASASKSTAPLPPITQPQQQSGSVDIFSRRPRRILVLYVGGTIGMKKNKEGALEPCAGYLTDEMHKMNELQEGKEIAPFDIIEYEELLDSSDMNAADYLRIASDVKKHYDNYDGFLIAHGTDTMHFTASALSFLLYNLAKPVIVTGAMVPLAEPFNDARRNIIISMMIASNPKICEVCIFFNDRLLRGNRCDKVYHTYGAFQSPNYPALGMMDAADFVLKERYLLPQPTGAMAMLSNLNGAVIVFDMSPDPDVDTILAVLEANRKTTEKANANGAAESSAAKPLVDAVVLILRGVGSVSGTVAKDVQRITAVADRRRIVTVVSHSDGQGTFSAQELARLHAFAPSVVYAGDMTAAAVEVKLMYLFGRGLSPERVAKDMACNLRGELTPSVVSSNL